MWSFFVSRIVVHEESRLSKNWMVLHGNSKEAMSDVCEVDKTIAVQLKGAGHNMFSVLVRKNGGWKGDGGGVKEGMGEVKAGSEVEIMAWLGLLEEVEGVMVKMKLLSFDVGGLCGWENLREVQKLAKEMRPLVLCLHETKL